MRPKPGYAVARQLTPLTFDYGPPQTKGGLRAEDFAEVLFPYAEIELRTGDPKDPYVRQRLAELEHMKRRLHLRFDKTCDHKRCF
jgi:hypothetical protein